jgi:hypothetical protein
VGDAVAPVSLATWRDCEILSDAGPRTAALAKPSVLSQLAQNK